MRNLTGRTLGGYRVLSAIGRGGMATVYLATRLADDGRVALKVLSSEVAENRSFLERFRREARALARLSHPSIVPLEAFEEVEGLAFLVMPYLPAGNLADRLARGPLHPVEGGRVIDDVASALQHAHDHGIVHRDVKPSNILLQQDGRALLSDFGLAQLHDASISLTGSSVLGTPAYASPEQALGHEVSWLSDQYSLGVVLFEMTTGALPFVADTPLAILLKHANDPTPAPRSVNPNIPPAVERVILRATAKRPDDRFASVGEMNTAFQAALAHALDPLDHPPPTIPLPERLRASQIFRRDRSRRRRRNLLAALAVLLALLLCGGGAFLTGLLGAARPTPDSAQVTALAGTIQALSTRVVAGDTGLVAPADVATAVLATLRSADVTLEPTALSLAFATEPTGVGGPAATSGAASTVSPSGPASPPPPTSPAATAPPTATIRISTSTVPGPMATTTATLLAASPTATTVPPSATSPPPTPTSSPCSLTQVLGSSRSGQEFTVQLRNNGSMPYNITAMSLAWPSQNQNLKKIELADEQIWNGEVESPRTITSWKSGSDRRIYPGGPRDLVFFFEDDVAASGYSFSITLEGSCSFGYTP